MDCKYFTFFRDVCQEKVPFSENDSSSVAAIEVAAERIRPPKIVAVDGGILSA